ncbi:anhydro-N-acetylmuramic acid kinase [Radiobacillus sp. PE A8.2]|uniref:anhydro-N-acetylmuramic acid kinase n=1 Tax=Radiobacillus sp. PE A8.2 TaxID=3380349 RepID=UPI00388DB7CD
MSTSSSSYVVGLMSGTSLDGIDAALVKLTEHNHNIDWQLINFKTVPFSEVVKKKLYDLCQPEKASIVDISTMNMLLGELFAEAAEIVIREANFHKGDIQLVSSHGQTIFHQPEPVAINGRNVTSTLQIGDIGVIAEQTGITTVGDFRTRDMAAGGQGAPLVPYADYLLFKGKIGRVLLNIGGISNLTVLPASANESDIIAFDTGPGNMMIDMFTNRITKGVQSFDRNGLLAAKGKVNEGWLNQLLMHPYYNQLPPKSTGRELFGEEFANLLWDEASKLGITDYDKLATVTALTGKTIAKEINRYVELKDIKEVLVSGGGYYNQTLMKELKALLPEGVLIEGTDYYGIPADAKEAITFAILGYQCYKKRTNNIPKATGAKKSVVMGKIAW